MDQQLLNRIGGVIIFALALAFTIINFNEWNIAAQMASVIVLGLFGAVIFVVLILPAIGDFIGSGVYSGGDQLTLDPSMKAAAKVSAGDFEGAVVEYLKLAKENQDDAFPVIEAAKVALEKLEDVDRAVEILKNGIGSAEALAADEAAESRMDDDGHAGLYFRLADIYAVHMENHESAIELMRVVQEKFSGSRHAISADNKLKEWEEAQFAKSQQ